MKELRQFFRGFQTGVKGFSENISIMVNSLLLSMVYLMGVGFTAVFAKVLRKRFLETKQSKTAETYWSDLDLKKKPIEEYYRQF